MNDPSDAVNWIYSPHIHSMTPSYHLEKTRNCYSQKGLIIRYYSVYLHHHTE